VAVRRKAGSLSYLGQRRLSSFFYCIDSVRRCAFVRAEPVLKRWLPFVLWLAFVATIIVFANRGQARAFLGWVNSLPLGDKAGHLFLIGVMAFLLNHALACRVFPIGPLRLLQGGLIIGVVMTLEEFSQLWFSSRTFDLGDLLANFLGVLLAELLMRARRR